MDITCELHIMRQAAMETDYCRAAFVCERASDLRGQFGGQRVANWPARDLSALVIRFPLCRSTNLYIYRGGCAGAASFCLWHSLFPPNHHRGWFDWQARSYFCHPRAAFHFAVCRSTANCAKSRCVCIYVRKRTRCWQRDFWRVYVCVGWGLVKRGM